MCYGVGESLADRSTPEGTGSKKQAKGETGAGPAPSASPLLERMAVNPKGDWSVKHIETVCSQLGITCTAPSRGSHYKVSSSLLEGALTVPAARPVKPIYIKRFVSLARAHEAHQRERK